MPPSAFTAYVAGVPTSGLTPSWHVVYDADTGVEQTTGLPSFNDLGGGLYSFEVPAGYEFTGIIDLGATAAPRYRVYKAAGIETFGAFDPAPAIGLTPTWDVYKNLDTGANVTAPTFTELGKGMYKFSKPAAGDPLGGVIDLGAGREPRYLKYDAQSDSSGATAPVISNITPAAGSQLATVRTPVVFDVTDVDPGVQLVVAKLKYAGSDLEHVVWDGSAFTTAWVARSTRTIIANGFRFSILPAAGWTRNISEIDVIAIDGAGNQS